MNQNTRCGNCESDSRMNCERTIATPCWRSKEKPLAMAYVPWQEWKNIYNPDVAFRRGTIFAELDLPFCGRGGCNS